jgi:signal transduction histidine kinase
MQTICHYVAIAKERLRLERELWERIEQLAAADRRKDEFLAMLVHELRNPLAAISSANELLRLRGSTEPMIKRAREAAARQTAHMARLLDDLLDVSRVTQGKITLNREEVPVPSFLESAIEASNPLMNARIRRMSLSSTSACRGWMATRSTAALIGLVGDRPTLLRGRLQIGHRSCGKQRMAGPCDQPRPSEG